MAEKIANPVAVFEGIDKITGRTLVFDAYVDETVRFGSLMVHPRVCYSRPPTEPEQTDSFVQIEEVTLAGEKRRIFSGWMFANSPGLNAVEHAVYDVWLVRCAASSAVPRPANVAAATRDAIPSAVSTDASNITGIVMQPEPHDLGGVIIPPIKPTYLAGATGLGKVPGIGSAIDPSADAAPADTANPDD